jgi:hypothetical protein
LDCAAIGEHTHVFAYLQDAAVKAGNATVAAVSMDDVLAVAKENNWDDCLLGQAPVAADLVSIDLPTRHRTAKSAAASFLDASDPDSSQEMLMPDNGNVEGPKSKKHSTIFASQSSSDQDASDNESLQFSKVWCLQLQCFEVTHQIFFAYRKMRREPLCLGKLTPWPTLL